MNNLNIDISKYKVEKSTITNQRQEMIKRFLDKINADRKGTKFKQMTARGVAMKLAYVKTSELYNFFKTCENYKGEFSKCFFGALRIK
jgi:hypothetical protein